MYRYVSLSELLLWSKVSQNQRSCECTPDEISKSINLIVNEVSSVRCCFEKINVL